MCDWHHIIYHATCGYGSSTLEQTLNTTLKLEVVRLSEMLVSCCNTTWCHNPEDLDL